MAGVNINCVVLGGRIANDPSFVDTAKSEIANFRLAVDRSMKNAAGESETDFINCVAFGNQAKVVKDNLDKGAPIVVEGRLQARTWENKEGAKQFTTEVVVNRIHFAETRAEKDARQKRSEGRSERQEREEPRRPQETAGAAAAPPPSDDQFGDDGDDDPFGDS